jgi:primosomal protein N' (replication factor Y) (superfamily II helicase)
MTIARVALPVAAEGAFDYWVPAGVAVAPGAIVRVHLGRRALVGVVVDISATTDVAADRLQPIGELLPGIPPLPADVLALAQFVSGYYQEPLGLVLAQMLPPIGAGAGASRGATGGQAMRLTDAGRAALAASLSRDTPARRAFLQFADSPEGVLPAVTIAAFPAAIRRTLRAWCDKGYLARTDPAPAASPGRVDLNAEQRVAVDAITAVQGAFAPFLLQGVTGSGKTDVYLEAARACIAAGRQALFLVPEINLTPQFAQRIADALPGRRAVTLHSRLAAGERRRNWRAAAEGDADLLLGTRLAVFAPLPRLGLVVIDEEHDPSFKQQDGVRYHGRDVAVWRARQRGVPIVLGSATPSLETLLQAQRGRYRHLRLTQRAIAPARLPACSFVSDKAPGTLEGISAPLLAAIETRLSRGEQSLLFVNRRGFAPSLLCSGCGWQAACHRRSARLVVHRDDRMLRCHHCGHAERLPRACPDCGNVDLLPLGHGTQRLERALTERFPAARIARVDRDSTQRKGAFAGLREQVEAGALDILVGTQMLAKGHDFPRLTLVGVVGADNALFSADFRATERLAALLFQVAGRAGRAALPGEVIVQTDFAAHAVFRALAAHDYESFAATLFAERRAAALPPFTYLALLAAEARERKAVDSFLAAAHAAGTGLTRAAHRAVEVFPPVPAALARRAGAERAQVVAQSEDRGSLQRFLTQWRSAIRAIPGRQVRWALDVDPLGFA